ncbi:unnamed protein product [Parajaminaea phylloscopi]
MTPPWSVGASDLPDKDGKNAGSFARAFDSQRRVIIALDIDAFYVAASRIRDPSLNGLPIGIKQKGILATCSYEARALGVRKLSSVSEGLRCCPELILVNGEDLSFFRKLSNQCWKLVRSLIWGAKVEKLGLDELFCDVTEMVDSHFRVARSSLPSDLDRQYNFCFARDPASIDQGAPSFTYKDQDAVPGHSLLFPTTRPRDDSWSSSEQESCISDSWSEQQRRLIVGARIAQYLRQKILTETGLSMSAGIAHNKVLAKLISSKNKPYDQTVFLPRRHEDVLELLKSHDVRSLMGFGSATVERLRERLMGRAGTGTGDVSDSVALDTAMCRQAMGPSDWIDLFGPRLGTRLHGLIHGWDEDEVVPAPLYPVQIGVEDTYRGLRGQAVADEMHTLSMSLLKRLEAELVDDDVAATKMTYERRDEPLDLPSDQGKSQALAFRNVIVRCYSEVTPDGSSADGSHQGQVRVWKRYPLAIRLSIRVGWDRRVSRQTSMPSEVFDLTQPRAQRAAHLSLALLAVFRSLLRQELASRTGEGSAGVNLINLSAVQLAVKRPAPSLGNFFPSESSRSRASGAEGSSPLKRPRRDSMADPIDSYVLSELPPELREEIARHYRLQLGATDKSLQTAESVNPTHDKSDQALQVLPADGAELICERCGVLQEPWLQHDHLQWPIQGVPPCFVSDKTVTEPTDIGSEMENDWLGEALSS